MGLRAGRLSWSDQHHGRQWPRVGEPGYRTRLTDLLHVIVCSPINRMAGSRLYGGSISPASRISAMGLRAGRLSWSDQHHGRQWPRVGEPGYRTRLTDLLHVIVCSPINRMAGSRLYGGSISPASRISAMGLRAGRLSWSDQHHGRQWPRVGEPGYRTRLTDLLHVTVCSPINRMAGSRLYGGSISPASRISAMD